MCTRNLIALLALSAPLQAQLTIRVSVDSGGAQGNSASAGGVISSDGNEVAFQSAATNLVAADLNGQPDIFLRDLVLGTTELVSLASSGAQANALALECALSSDGRYVVFSSSATNLVAIPSNGNENVFVRDRQSGTTQLVSVGPAGTGVALACEGLSISADGRFVCFESNAGDVVPGDANAQRDVFLFDRSTGTTEIISVDSAGLQHQGLNETAAMSGDGRYVVFASSAALAAGGFSNGRNVYLRDRAAGTTTCVSVPNGGGLPNQASFLPTISEDGGSIAFCSLATNLTADPISGPQQHVFARSLVTGHARLVSRTATAIANGTSSAPNLSSDGRFVGFTSQATNLSPIDTTGDPDLYLADMLTGIVRPLSQSDAGLAVNANVDVSRHFLSTDGQTTAFESSAQGFVGNDTNSTFDVFVHGRAAPPVVNLCLGDGTEAACPCNNLGGFGRGCNNSNSTGGAILLTTGQSRLSHDTLVLRVQGEPPDVFNLFVQGDAAHAPASFGDGLSCVGGQILRLYGGFAVNGSLAKPGPGELSVSTQPAALGFPIPPGATRVYQVLYRDPEDNFCPAPLGSNVNLSQAVALVWGP